MKLQRIAYADGRHAGLRFYCPGCGYGHWYRLQGDGPKWEWNGDMERPTFTPSLLVNASIPEQRCHLFVRDGMIEYCADCHHELRGQTVPLPEIPD